jgi:16S rRNA (cytosine1402-N4)-methyltransferase
MTDTSYHIPVLFEASLTGLGLPVSGSEKAPSSTEGHVWVDLTFGGGGHSRGILERMGPNDKLFAFDQDPDALATLPDDPRFTLIPENFRFLRNFLRLHGVREVHGLLADLGVSSHQFDTGARGFSTRMDGPLDMRMNPGTGRSAAMLLDDVDEISLARILGQYGEVKNAMRTSRTLLASHAERRLTTTEALREAIEHLAPRGRTQKYLAQVFQGLRIEVNDELGALREVLEHCTSVMANGGRIVFISYHSLEDRLVKHFMRSGNFEDKPERDFHGKLLAPFHPLNRKVIVADEAEQALNPRSRSARLRVAERTDEKEAR